MAGESLDADQPTDTPTGSIELVLAELQKLRDTFDSKIRYDAVRESRIEALHREVEESRGGVHLQLLRPVLTDLIAMYDDLTSRLDRSPEGDEELAEELVKALTYFRDSIEETLSRNGVTMYTTEGNGINRARQQVISVVVTDDSELDRKLAERLRPGFELDGKVLRSEWVTAYRYEEPS